jgi:hypothetical protein
MSAEQKEFEELKAAYDGLRGLYKKYFPKVDPKLVEELVAHGSNSADSKGRLYALQVMAREGEGLDRVHDYFMKETGRVPTEYEGGSHYVINVYPTLDMIKDVQGYAEVGHIQGDYTFGSYAVHNIHMHRGEDEQSRIAES